MWTADWEYFAHRNVTKRLFYSSYWGWFFQTFTLRINTFSIHDSRVTSVFHVNNINNDGQPAHFCVSQSFLAKEAQMIKTTMLKTGFAKQYGQLVSCCSVFSEEVLAFVEAAVVQLFYEEVKRSFLILILQEVSHYFVFPRFSQFTSTHFAFPCRSSIIHPVCKGLYCEHNTMKYEAVKIQWVTFV